VEALKLCLTVQFLTLHAIKLLNCFGCVFYFIYQVIFVHIVSFAAFYFLNANNVAPSKRFVHLKVKNLLMDFKG